jgi:hypothetical protein
VAVLVDGDQDADVRKKTNGAIDRRAHCCSLQDVAGTAPGFGVERKRLERIGRASSGELRRCGS